MPDIHPHDELGAYAVGVLDADERAVIDRHLAGCPECREELGEFRQVTHALEPAMAVARPPAATWDAIASRLTPRETATAPVTEPTPIASRRPRGRVVLLGWAATAAALVAVIGWATFETVGHSSQSSLQQLASSNEGYVVPLVGTNPAASGRLYISDDETQGGLAVYDLPTAPGGKTYQLWFISNDGQWTQAGNVTVNAQGNGLTKVALPGPVKNFDGVAVCTEPPPGSSARWGEMLLAGPVYER